MNSRCIAIIASCCAAAACARSGVADDASPDAAAPSADGGANAVRDGGNGDDDDSGPNNTNKDGGDGGGGVKTDSGPAKRLFVTKGLHSGNFGSVTAGDAICQSAADAANLGGTFKAWLSDGTKGARAHVGSNGPWALLDGSMVFSQPNATSPMRDLDIDETATAGNKGFVWTGTAADGTATASTCTGWAGGGSATTGYPHEKLQWTDDNSSGTPCNFKGHLYCFEQ